MIVCEHISTLAHARSRALAALLAAVPLPAPSPSPDPGSDALYKITQLNDAVQHVVAAAPGVIGHAAIGTFWRLVVLAIAYLGVRALLPFLRGRLGREERDLITISAPAEANPDPAQNAWPDFFRGLAAVCPPWWKRALFGVPWLTFELESTWGQVAARISCPRRLTALVGSSLRAAVPGAQVDVADYADLTLPKTPAARARLALWREPLYSLAQARLDPLAAGLGALTATPGGIVQVAIAPDPGWERSAQRRLDQLSGLRGRGVGASLLGGTPGLVLSVLSDLLSILTPSNLAGHAPVDAHHRASSVSKLPSVRGNLPPADKAWVTAWRVEVRVRAWSPARGQAKIAVHAVVGGFRALDGANRVKPKRVLVRKAFDRALSGRQGPRETVMRLSANELAAFFHLPVRGARMVPAGVRVAPVALPQGAGSLLCRADGLGGEAVLFALSDRRHHASFHGPTGSGKSTANLNLALQDVANRTGVGVVDPKGDLITDLLARIDRPDFDRVVLFDPSRQEFPVGLNLLECPDPSMRELVCDSVIAIFRKTYERFWGPRTEDVLRAALLTLLRHPGTTICEVPLLLLNDRVRATLTRDLKDPVGLDAFWKEYEQLSPSQRLAVVGPVMNKLRAFLLRPSVRNILGQSRSSIDFREIMDGGGVLLVNLAKGTLGEETSRLMGSFLVARIWQAAMGRITQPIDRRRDFNLYLDEFQNYLELGTALDDVLAEARAYRLNLTLSNQHFGQLPPAIRDALDANARTRLVFQCGQEDARYLARQYTPLTEHQLMSLGRHQVAVRLCVDGRVEAPFTGMMEPPPPSRGEAHAAELARISVSRYGRPRLEVEAEIEQRLMAQGLRGGYREAAA